MNKRLESKAATRSRLLTFAQVAFERNGYTNTDLRTIARDAGLSTGAIFANFPGKAELYEAAMHKPAPTVATMDASQDLLAALWELSQRVARDGGDTAQADRAIMLAQGMRK